MKNCDVYDLVKDEGLVFLSYGGFLTQSLIAGVTESLEKEAENNNMTVSEMSNLFTVFIEMAQNMMHYSKTEKEDCRAFSPRGLILIRKIENNYTVYSTNIVDIDDKEKIENTLNRIKLLSKDEIKQKYRELRRSGKDSHQKGGGIGFYDIAKRCEKIEYNFDKINDRKYKFILEVTLNKKIKG